MRRPVTFGAAALSAGIWTADAWESPWVLIFLAMPGLFALASKLNMRKCVAAMCLLLFAGALFFHISEWKADPYQDLNGSEIQVVGRVVAAEEREHYLQLELRTSRFQPKVMVRLYTEDGPKENDATGLRPAHLAGSDIAVSGTVIRPEGARNPGGFDYRRYLKTCNITAILVADETQVEVVGKGNPLLGPVLREKHRFMDSLEERMGREKAALLSGMLFGETAAIDKEQLDQFRANGTAHILAVSGIHVGIAYAALRFLLRKQRKAVIAIFSVCFLFLYAALAGFSPSVVRAAMMILLYIFCDLTHRRYDLLSAACLTGSLMLIINPWQLFHSGFQLSFLAILSLSFLLPLGQKLWENWIGEGRRGWIKPMGTVFLPLIAIQIGMLPALTHLFQTVPVAAIPLNPPVIALAGLLIPLGLALFLLHLVGGPVFLFLSLAAEMLLWGMSAINSIPEHLGISSLVVSRPPLSLLVLWYVLLCFICSETFWNRMRKSDWKSIGMIVAAFFLLAALVFTTEDKRFAESELIFVDVGQGDCLHIKTPSGKNILIDGGGSLERDVGKEVLLPYLLRNRITSIDLVVVTHLHEDHYGGIRSLSGSLPVSRLGVFKEAGRSILELSEDTGLPEASIFSLASGSRIVVEEGVVIEILYPPRGISDIDDENHNSLIVRVSIEGISVLMTGDIGFEGEEALMKIYGRGEDSGLQTDVLKIGHHGSRFSTSEEFLESVAPQLAIIQVGKNNFGHPHRDVIEKLEKRDIMYFRNDHQGAIMLNIENGQIHWSTMLPERLQSSERE